MKTILRKLNIIQNQPGLSSRALPELTLGKIQEILGGPQVIQDFERFTFFKEEKYQRNSILWFPNFELVCICWLPGQASSIHSHGFTSGGMRVVSGKIFEEDYKTPQENPVAKRIYEPGECGWVTPSTLHRVGNASTIPAVTIHLYSPPFQTAGVQKSLDSRIAA